MRSLAQKLGIKAASLYWPVRNRQELLSLPADEICRPMREPDRALPWRRQLEAPGHEYRRVLPAHRDEARVPARTGCGWPKSRCAPCATPAMPPPPPQTARKRGCRARAVPARQNEQRLG
jgi:hypothetical protein